MTEKQQIQRLFKIYKKETQQQIVDPIEFSKWLENKGWTMPTPPDPVEILAKKVKDALRDETRRDATTGLEYKVNLSFSPDNGQGSFLVDVDEAPRHIIHKCLVQRRNQTSGDVYQWVLIEDHWNAEHPDQEPIRLPQDFVMDVLIRKNSGGSNDPLAA